jgi:pimeloyl-ACP methyl ester carboxylesterase
MIGTLIGVAVIASVIALVLIYGRVLALTFPEKLSTDEVYQLTTGDLWKLRVCRYRKGRTNGQPVLLVHGANVNQHTFTTPKGGNLVEYLVERGFDCWTVDLRGCRSSEAPFERHRNQITTDDFLNFDIPDVIRLVQHETGYAKIHYCGQSLGGMLLYAYVLKFGSSDIASAVTLGAPLGFEGVRFRRSAVLLFLVTLCPPLSGAIARGMIPFALLFRTNPIAFPMNMRNIARGMNTGSFYNMLENPLPGVLRDLVKWVNTSGWRMDAGDINVEDGLKTLDFPLFAIFAPLDPFVPIDKAKAFFEALPTGDKRLLIASRALGCKRDYNHCDLAFGLEGPREIFGPVARWFETHSSREQIARDSALTVTGYQAPLRANERANILSGDSYVRRATPVASESDTELRADVATPPIPPVDLEVLEPLTAAEVPEVAPEAPIADRPAPVISEATAPVNLESLVPLETVEPGREDEIAVEPFEVISAKKPANRKKPAAKTPAAKAPAGKKPATKKPSPKKAATRKPTATRVAAPDKAILKKSAPKASGKGLDLTSASAALSALRPNVTKGKASSAAPIRVKKSGNTSSAPGKNEPVETPKSVLKALSNASNALDAFKKPGAKK